MNGKLLSKREVMELGQTYWAVNHCERVKGCASGLEVAAYLGITPGSASRRIAKAIDAGWVKNLEWSRGRPQQLIIQPIP